MALSSIMGYFKGTTAPPIQHSPDTMAAFLSSELPKFYQECTAHDDADRESAHKLLGVDYLFTAKMNDISARYLFNNQNNADNPDFNTQSYGQLCLTRTISQEFSYTTLSADTQNNLINLFNQRTAVADKNVTVPFFQNQKGSLLLEKCCVVFESALKVNISKAPNKEYLAVIIASFLKQSEDVKQEVTSILSQSNEVLVAAEKPDQLEQEIDASIPSQTNDTSSTTKEPDKQKKKNPTDINIHNNQSLAKLAEARLGTLANSKKNTMANGYTWTSKIIVFNKKSYNLGFFASSSPRAVEVTKPKNPDYPYKLGFSVTYSESQEIVVDIDLKVAERVAQTYKDLIVKVRPTFDSGNSSFYVEKKLTQKDVKSKTLAIWIKDFLETAVKVGGAGW